jgi:acetolactate synthase-1/2/3 large subunit
LYYIGREIQMAMQKGADIIFDYLIKENVPYMFGVPGHGTMGLLDALPKYQDRMKVVVVHHEQAAGHMADAFFRIAHQPVATFTSVGPGSANLPIALGNALMDDSAFLAITGNVATSQFSRGTFQEVHRHYQADFTSVIRPYVKRSFQVVQPDQLPRALRQAFTTMTMGCPGPVNLDVPFNIFQEEVEGIEVPDPEQWREGIDRRSGASPEAVQRALDALVTAERPVILVGNGAALSEAEEDIRALAEILNIPVAYSPLGMAVMGADHPLCLGSVGRDGNYPANEATSTADVLLTLGAQFDDRAASAWLPGYTFTIPPTKLIQVDIDELAIGRNYPTYLGVNADVRTFSRQLLSLIGEGGHRGEYAEWNRQVAAWKDEWTEYQEEHYRPDAKPIHPEHIIRTLRKALPQEGILAVDVGSHHTWVVSRWESYLPRTVVQAWGFGAMGFGAAGALGAKLAAPDRPVVCLTGDSGFLMVSHVVATAVEYDIPVTWVVWNNCGYGVTRGGGYGMINRFRRHATGELLSPDYATLARGYGAEGIRVDAPGELGDALERAITSNRPTVVDVVVDPVATPVSVGTTQLPPWPPREIVYPRASFIDRGTGKQ